MRGCAVILCAALFVSLAPSRTCAQDDIERFEALAGRLRSSVAGPRRHPVADEAIEIVIRRAARSLAGGPRAMERAASPFAAIARRAADPEGPPAAGYGLLTVRADARAGVAAMTVTYGAVTRLAAFWISTGRRLSVPPIASWMVPWSARPVVTSDGTVALLGESVQDAGMRTALRLDVFSVGDRALSRTMTASLARLLDWGGFRLSGDRLTMTGIEPPRSFMTTSPERLFTVTREYRLAEGKARLVKESLGQPEVRCVDQWLTRAYAAKRPDKLQKRLRADFPAMGVIETWSVSRSPSRPVVELTFPEGTARFALSQGRSPTVIGYAFRK